MKTNFGLDEKFNQAYVMKKRKNANEIQLDVTDCSIKGAVFLRISHQEYKKRGILFSAHLCNSEGSPMLLNDVGITKKFKRAQMRYKGKEAEDMTQAATSLKDTMMKLFLKQQKEHDGAVVVDVSGRFIAQDSYS